MRTAYINKENKVVYIAAFEEDKIIPNGKGKFLFGGSAYDAEAGKWNHILGAAAARTAEVSSAQDVQRSTEEVFAVDGSGLGVGDIYTPPQEPALPSLEEQISRAEAEVQRLEKQLALDYLAEKTAQSPGFAEYLTEQSEGVNNE